MACETPVVLGRDDPDLVREALAAIRSSTARPGAPMPSSLVIRIRSSIMRLQKRRRIGFGR